ncbi:MAG: hypothetical protein ABIQ01_06100 [Pseudolysinimonas sp.]
MTSVALLAEPAVDVYLLHYDRPPKTVAGDLAVIDDQGAAIVVTASAFRIQEARRTDRAMSGPYPASLVPSTLLAEAMAAASPAP